MSDAELLNNWTRVQDKVARIVASVHGVVPKALADQYTTTKDQAQARGLIQDA